LFGDRALAIFDEIKEQLQHLGLDRQSLVTLPQLESSAIQDELAQTKRSSARMQLGRDPGGNRMTIHA
jgi:hypothetical protein